MAETVIFVRGDVYRGCYGNCVVRVRVGVVDSDCEIGCMAVYVSWLLSAVVRKTISIWWWYS